MFNLKKYYRKETIKKAFFGLFVLTSGVCQASYPNVLGTWAGTLSYNLSGCNNPANNGTGSVSGAFIVSQQNGSSFNGQIDGGGTVTGSVTAAGNVSGSYTDSTGRTVSFSGTVSNNTWESSGEIVSTGSTGCSGSGTVSLTRGGGATSVQVQQSRQIVRATNNLISQHLATEVSKAFSFMPDFKTDNKLGASADQGNDYQPDAFWGSVSISEITEDGNKTPQFNTKIYQFVGGMDKRIGDFFVGTGLTYAYSETKQTGADSNSQVIGITPYGAWSITDYLFVSGLAGYNYTAIREEATGTDTDVHDYTLEGNINFHKILWQSVIVKTRVGSRYRHTEVSSVSNTQDASSDELMWLGDLELGYRFRNGLISHIGTYYEYFDREASVQQATPVHDGVLYLRGGVDYPVWENLSLSAKVQADMNNEDTDIITGSVSIRLEI